MNEQEKSLEAENTTLEVRAGPHIMTFVNAQDWKDRGYTLWDKHYLEADSVLLVDASGSVIKKWDEPIVFPLHAYRRRPVAIAALAGAPAR